MRKNILTFICLLLAGYNAAQTTETYYYDQNFKGVAGKEFCSYYRIVSCSKDFGNKTRLFDSQGHLLSESGFLKIDKFDDEKSVLDGKYESYYPNGNIYVQAFFVNGKYSGGYRKFFEKGQLAVEATYKNGRLHGKYTEFFSNGNVAKESNYVDGLEHGKTIQWNDQHTFSIETEYAAGNASDCSVAKYADKEYRLRNSDWSVVKEQPTGRHRATLNNGEERYALNGVGLSVRPAVVHDYGKYLRCYITIDNYTPNTIHVEPSDFVATAVREDGSTAPVKVQSAAQYQKKIEVRQTVAAVAIGLFMGAAGSMAGNSDGKATATVTTNYVDENNRVVMTQKDKVEVYDPELARLQADERNEAMASAANAMDASFAQKQAERLDAYLQPMDIAPFSSVSCYVNVLLERGVQKYDVSFSLDGVDYKFAWAWDGKSATALGGFVGTDALTITDPNFNKALLRCCDINKDGVVDNHEANSVVSLDVSAWGIHDMSGISMFKNLETLHAGKNQFTVIDLSDNQKLKTATVASQKLQYVVLPNDKVTIDVAPSMVRYANRSETASPQPEKQHTENHKTKADTPKIFRKPSVVSQNGKRLQCYNDSNVYVTVDFSQDGKKFLFDVVLQNKGEKAVLAGETTIKASVLADGGKKELVFDGLPFKWVQPKQMFKSKFSAKARKGDKVLVSVSVAGATYEFFWPLRNN